MSDKDGRALAPARWARATEVKMGFAIQGKNAARHFLAQTQETLRPDMGVAVEAVSPYEDGSGGALEVSKAAYRYLRYLRWRCGNRRDLELAALVLDACKVAIDAGCDEDQDRPAQEFIARIDLKALVKTFKKFR